MSKCLIPYTGLFTENVQLNRTTNGRIDIITNCEASKGSDEYPAKNCLHSEAVVVCADYRDLGEVENQSVQLAATLVLANLVMIPVGFPIYIEAGELPDEQRGRHMRSGACFTLA